MGDGQGTKAFGLVLLSYIFLKIRNKLALSQSKKAAPRLKQNGPIPLVCVVQLEAVCQMAPEV